MNVIAPLVRIPIGVIVERCKANSPWSEFTWRPTAVLGGLPDADPWTQLASEEETVTFYAGAAEIELYRTETENYRDNLVSAAPSVWVALLSTAGDPPYEIAAVTADPAEGEALTEPGQGIVEAVPMPTSVRDTIASFISEHHVERTFEKRKRNRAVARNTGAAMSNDTDFLARWSRRKHRAATDRIRQSKSESTPDDIVSGTSAALAQGENRLPFDPAGLPTIESISAESSIGAFLEAGVPVDLARAALRRVWLLDPAIRDFVGLSENSWDFNAPGAIPGFGPIDEKEVGRLLTRLLGEPDPIAAAVHPPVVSPLAEDSQTPAGQSDPLEYQVTNGESVALVSAKGQQLGFDEIDVAGDLTQQGRATAPQSELTPSECLSPILRRGHGGASPQLLYARKATDNGE